MTAIIYTIEIFKLLFFVLCVMAICYSIYSTHLQNKVTKKLNKELDGIDTHE